MERNLNFNHLHYFHVVASEGSLAAAARKLGVTQPTISGQLKQLEAALGGPLFDRSPGNELRLNERGRRVLEHTTVMFAASGRLVEELSDARPATGAKLLEIGVAAAVSKTFIARFFMPLFELADIYPRIRVADHDALIRQLSSLELDVVLTDVVPGEPGKLGLEQRTVHSAPMVAVAAPKLAARVRRFPEDLGATPFLHHAPSSRARLDIDAFFRRRGITPVTIGEVDDVTLMARAAIDGIAVAVVPDTVVEGALARGALQVIATLDELRTQVHAFFHHRETPQRVIDAIDRLTQRASGQIAA